MKKTAAFIFLVFLCAGAAFAGPRFTSIPKDRQDSVLAAARSQGIDVMLPGIVSLGFESDSSGAKLVVISLDSTGTPGRAVFALTASQYEQLSAAAAMAPSPAVAGEKPASAAEEKAVLKEKKTQNQDGRVYFMIHNTLKSTYVIPANIANINNNLDASVMGGITLLSYGGTIYASYKFTQNRELGYGRVGMMNYGGELGIAYPALLAGFLESIIDADANYDDEGDFPAMEFNAWTTMLAFPAGIYIGSRVNVFGNTQYGNVTLCRFLGRSAFLYGFLMPLFLPDQVIEDHYPKIATALTMGLIPTGNYLGYRLVKGKDLSSGRGFFIETTGIMGGLTGLLIPIMLEIDVESKSQVRMMVGSVLAGHALGTWLGIDFRKGEDYSFGQGVFTAISATGGAALALSLPLIAQANDHRVYEAMGILGAWSGLFFGERLSKSIFDKSPRDDRQAFNVSFPALSQLPLLAITASQKKSLRDMNIPVTDIIRVNF